ncbi:MULTISPECIES: hypothetical protein [Clostridium]|uniref:hypothetical protein n=1 Tax=Clostridium TaxID=1485 RepID=UPI001EEE3B98|nr:MULTISPECIES: hypothetical protein [Clostridium]WRY51034.1 hypothetical protein P8F83_20695 [Clostridium intestinale]
MVDKIKKKLEDLIEEIEGVCEIEDISFSYEKNSDLLTQVTLNSSTILRLYSTKKGLKIDDSVAKDKEVANKVINKWKELHYNEIENKNFTYKKVKDFSKSKENLLGLAEGGFVSNEYKGNSNIYDFCIVIEDKEVCEKVTINFYKTGSIMVQGYTGNLWERVCRAIEEGIDCDVKDIFRRIATEALNIEDDTKDDFSKYDESLKEKLTEQVYNYLSIEDREYLTSSEKLIQEKVKFRRYNSILCPAVLSLEGFFKILIVKLKILKTYEISNSKFNFGCIFDDKHKLLDSKYRIMTCKDEMHRKEIKEVIELLYSKIKAFRNPACHSSGGMGPYSSNVRSFERCKEIYEKEVIQCIKDSYYTVYK